MANRVPKRGPFVLTTQSGNTVDVWYSRDTRFWVVQLKTPTGDQIGPLSTGEAAYEATRDDAVTFALELADS